MLLGRALGFQNSKIKVKTKSPKNSSPLNPFAPRTVYNPGEKHIFFDYRRYTDDETEARKLKVKSVCMETRLYAIVDGFQVLFPLTLLFTSQKISFSF